jgi:hypothetical protein
MARNFELLTPIDGTAEEAWGVLTDFASYSQWNRLVPFGQGSATPGSRLDLRMRGRPGRFRPMVVSIDPLRELILEASVGHRTLIHLTHWFTFIPSLLPPSVLLRQRWLAEGALIPVVWPVLRRYMARFEEFGLELGRRVVECRLLSARC